MIKRTGRLRLIRTADLAELRTAAAELAELRPLLAQAQQSAELATDSAIRTETTAETLREELARTITAAARAEGELTALRAQQARLADHVYVLLRFGEVHSVHASWDAAEIAAESEGAPRAGWGALTRCSDGTPTSPREVPWRILRVPRGGGQR